ncbi:hypothetical protein MCOR04_006264 [Pyricularia oryzae]|nr:hypothetical protein MCOR15_002921 [Pyricularia oryzae]KAI6578829.1 hypothetical protein MCOR04_006264 [Pyricularia oryzae]
MILLAFWVMPRLQRRRMLSRFPIHGGEHGSHLSRDKVYWTNSEIIYLQAYQKFPNVVHRMTTADGEKNRSFCRSGTWGSSDTCPTTRSTATSPELSGTPEYVDAYANLTVCLIRTLKQCLRWMSLSCRERP